jgi:nucleoside-diphosphate-sugar epimerase
MKVIMAGGTGFVGKALVEGLLGAGHQIVLLRRPGSKSQPQQNSNIEIATVDLEHPIVSGELKGDAIINLVGIIREYPSKGITFHKAHLLVTKYLINWARETGIKRFLQMSALGVKPNAATRYEQTKYAAESYIKESGLDWTIFQPSIIIGPGGELIRLLSNMIKRLPLVPIIGDGQYKVQPVYIGDVVAGYVRALGSRDAIGRTFEIGGPEIMTFDQMIDKIGEAMGRSHVRKFHQPLWMLKPLASIFGRFSWFPVTREQLTMLAEENYALDNTYFEFFGISLKPLEEALRGFIR